MSLIESIAEIKEHLAINMTSQIKTLRPYIEQAQIKFIKPVLGAALYNALVAEYESSGSSSSTTMSDLLEQVQRPLAYLSYSLYLPTGNIMASDSGIHISVTDTKKQAFQWQVDEFQNSLLELGFTAIEELYIFLEENLEDYPTWESSEAYTTFRETFIQTAKEFQKYINIHSSRRVFVAIMPVMKKIEEFEIANVLGEDLYNEMKEDLTGGSGSGSGEAILAEHQEILPWIKAACAHLTVARAATDQNIELNANGVHMIATSGVNMNAKKSAGNDAISPFIYAAQRDGQAYLHKIRDYLNKNASEEKFAKYYSSDLYEELESDEYTPRSFTNSKDKKSFRI